MVSFTVQKLLSFIRSHLFIFFYFHFSRRWVKKDLAVIYVVKCSMFSSKSLIVSGLTLRSLIHFEFIFVYGIKECSNFILLHVAVQFSQHHLLKKMSFLHCIFLPHLSKKVTICAWVYLWAFYPVPLIYISVFVPVPYCLDYCNL